MRIPENRAEVRDHPVDPLRDPAVQRDQRFVERIHNIEVLWRRRGCAVQPDCRTATVGGCWRGTPRVGGLRCVVRRFSGAPRVSLISHYLPLAI